MTAARAQRRWILTALGQDRPGMVAGVTETLFRLGCNLEDSAMTRLAGYFTIMLAFTAPRALSASTLERICEPLSRRFGLAVHVNAVASAARAGSSSKTTYDLTVYGADHPGIVYRVSRLLADAGVNITDVSTRLSANSKKRAPLYLMVLELQLPPRLNARGLEQRLRRLGHTLGVEIGFRASDASIL